MCLVTGTHSTQAKGSLSAHTRFAYDKDKGIGTSLREMEGWVLVQERRCECCEIEVDGNFMWELALEVSSKWNSMQILLH